MEKNEPGNGVREQTVPPLTELALLWAMRTWVAGRRRRTAVENKVTPVFTRLGAPLASGYLFGLMWVLDNAACRNLAIYCPSRPGVSSDEQILLDILSLTQERQSFERLLLFRTLLKPTAATPAGTSATGLVNELNRAGLFLQPCFGHIRHHAFPPATAAWGRQPTPGELGG